MILLVECSNSVFNISVNGLITPLIASIFTLIGAVLFYYFTESKRKGKIKKSINDFLVEIIQSDSDGLKTEISKVIKFVQGIPPEKEFYYELYSSFNSRILKSFKMEDLYSIYDKDKLTEIVRLIGYLDFLQERFPHYAINNLVKETDEHIEKHFDDKKHKWKDYSTHRAKCPDVKYFKELTVKNLENALRIVKKLDKSVLILLSKRPD